MQTIDVQLIGGEHDGKLTEVTAQELRMDEPIFMPYVPSEANRGLAYVEYVRMIFGTQAGSLVSWINPHLSTSAGKKTMRSIIEGDRNAEGIWLIKGSDPYGQLRVVPLEQVQGDT